jgi:class 3 adenylate cyclase/tetratricopeptide (TPR) repeat protein
MHCPSCGAAVRPDQRFCAACGSRLAKACSGCGSELPQGARFCPDCGTPAADGDAGAAAAGTGATAAATSGRLGPPGAGQEPAAPVAERRLVSVLFCDLVGFTAASAARDAEETRELLTAYFELARERIERYGGTIEKFIGDAVMAVWGVPTAREDDAERAVRAALDLVGAIPRLADASGDAVSAGDATGGQGLVARAAVMTGEAAVTLGAEGQGMVAGDLVNTASRLQSVAEPGAVLVGDSTRIVTERAIAYEPVAEQRLKGKPLPMAAWRAVRTIALVGGRFGSDELEPPFVGRDAELRFITELYHSAARERRLRLASVIGQAGIGKSRLSRELEKYLDGIAETVWWHRGRCPAYGEGLTFWAVGEMVRRRAGIAEGDDQETTAERLRSMLAEFVTDAAERARLEPPLRALLGLDTLGWAPHETGELYVAWRTLFERIAERGPVVLVFEDLQWADDGLVGFIQHLLEWSRTQPVLVVTLARPEFLENRPTWGAGLRNFASLYLEPLPDAAIAEMLEGVVPGLPAAAVRTIVRRAEGVPLYAVETIRMMIAQGVLARDGSGYRVTGDVETIAIPDSLRGLVAARLDTLPSDARAVLQDAAVLGHSFEVEALAAISGSDPEALEPLLHELVRRELLRQETDPRSPERGQYLWVQSVIREVAYATLSKRDRRARHVSAARYYETLGEEEVAGILADHYVEAWRASGEGAEAEALAGQARVALRAAAERAERLRNWRQAASFVSRALEVTPEPAERPALLERAGDLIHRAGSFTEAEARYREGIDALPGDADPDTRARLAAKVGRQILNELRAAEALAWLREAVAAAGPELDGPGRVMLEGQLGRALFLSDENAEALSVLARTIDAAERVGPVDALVEAIVSFGTAGMYLGSSLNLAVLYGSVELARRHGVVEAELRALNNLSVWAQEADPPLSWELNERAIAICDRMGYDSMTWQVELPNWVAQSDGLDAAEAMVAELAERVAPGSLDENGLQQTQMVLAYLRGDAEGFERLRAALSAGIERTPEAVAQEREALVAGLLVLGRLEDAAAVTEANPDDPRLVPARLLLGLLARDVAGVTRDVELLPRISTWEGPLARGLRAVATSGARLIEGVHGQDLARYLEGLVELRAALRPAYWTVACAALIGIVGLDRPEVRAAEAEVRAEMERIGAHGCVAVLDRAIAAAPSPASGPDPDAVPASEARHRSAIS